MTISGNRIYAPPRRPYYVEAPPYRRTSAGIKVLHLLCHTLNLIGEEAYVTTDSVNPALRTPTITTEVVRRHLEAGVEPIVVYPEVVKGNPRNARSVVRYLLNRAGMIGGDEVHDDTELVFAFGRNILPEGVDPENVLFLPPTDTRIFHNQDNPLDDKREGILLYAGRHIDHIGEYPELAARAALITSSWPETHQALAELFRRSEAVYCFESTSLALEALLCGCPAIILPSPSFRGDAISTSELGRDGLAFTNSPDEIAFACRTVRKMWDNYQAAEKRFWAQLEHFVIRTQTMPVQPIGLRTEVSQHQMDMARRFEEWQSKQSPQELDAQLLAERMVREWAYRPQFHLLMDLQTGEEPLLADTLDSLSTQLYADWMLTVATHLEAPDGIEEIQRVQWLSLKDASHASFVLNEMAIHSPCQWVVRIIPGLTFEPHALLIVADQVNLRPDWALVYTDEDTREPNGKHSLPCFKPGLDPFMLRNQSYPGSFVAVRKDAFMAAGQFGAQSGAEVYDLTLRILDSCCVEALGHIDAMLVHLPRESTRSTHTVAETAAVQAHLQRQQTDAVVRDGEFFGVRTLTARTASLPSISILIESHGAPDQALQTAQQFLTQTDYPEFEVLITDASNNPLHLQLLRLGAEQLECGRLRTVDTSGAAGRVDRIRLMLIAARSTHMFFVAAESRAAQPVWLKELALAASWPGVGAVQAGLVNMGNGQMVCPPYTPALLFSPLGLAPETIHTMPTQQRMLAALDERALLVSKAVLSAFLCSGETISHTYWALALARHLQESGLHMLWKPEVQVRLLSSATQSPRFGVYDRPQGQTQHEDITFIERQLEWLASSHLYNGQLSYSKPCQFNLNRVTEWDTHQGDRPKLLVLGGEGLPLPAESQRNVTRLVQSALAQVSYWTLEPDACAWITLMEIVRAQPGSVLFGHSVGAKQKTLLTLMQQYLPKVTRVFCADDGGDLSPRTAHPEPQLVDLVCAVDDVLQLAHKVVVTSATLAEALRPYHPQVQLVMPWPDGSALMAAPVTVRGEKLRIGVIHPENDPAVLALLADLLEVFKNEAIFVCFGEPPARLNGHGLVHIPSQHASFVTPDHLQTAQIDLVLLPRGGQFWPGLADNRLVLNAIAAGCSCLSGPVTGFARSPLVQLGLDANTWVNAIKKLLDSPEAQTTYADTLRHWAGQHFDTKLGQASAAAAYLN